MKYGLIGEKLGHSFSKIIHEQLGNYDYQLREISENELDSFMMARNFSGINVTIPYKLDVIPYCDKLSEEAKVIGSVNTLVVDGCMLIGHNTDCYGFLMMAKAAGISFSDKKVLVLGSGGTSRTAAYAARNQGAEEVVIMSRSGNVTYDNLPKHCDADIIVNTTPVGMFPNNLVSAVDIKKFTGLQGVLDVVYNPLRTKLILDAADMGIPCSGGLMMLVAQAKKATEIFSGTQIDDNEMHKIYKNILLSVSNIVLIGMPGSGKSSVGRILAKKLNREFIDTDEEISKKDGRTIPAIFEQDGEEAFRKKESYIISQAGKLSGKVISIGGGGVLREENRLALKQNGIIIFIDRPLENLQLGYGRPLSQSIEKIREMSDVRMPIYQSLCDFRIENTGTREEASNKIIEEIM